MEQILLTNRDYMKTIGYFPCDNHDVRKVALAATKKALKSVGKESRRMDGTIYLVPDYVEYRKALKEVGLK